jgi:hypothetical protein
VSPLDDVKHNCASQQCLLPPAAHKASISPRVTSLTRDQSPSSTSTPFAAGSNAHTAHIDNCTICAIPCQLLAAEPRAKWPD